MRFIATIKGKITKPKRLMIFDSGESTYLFEFNTLEDGPAACDYWFESLELAFESCKEDYGLNDNDWTKIPDPPINCQHDWIQPVRIVGRENGNPQWGQYEKMENGKWVKL